jgi:hypothetical protein
LERDTTHTTPENQGTEHLENVAVAVALCALLLEVGSWLVVVRGLRFGNFKSNKNIALFTP